jgi:hypothetical protein
MAARCLFSMMQGYEELPLSSHTFPGAAKKANLKIKGPLITLSLHMGLDPTVSSDEEILGRRKVFFFLSLITTSTAQAVRGSERVTFSVFKNLYGDPGQKSCNRQG